MLVCGIKVVNVVAETSTKALRSSTIPACSAATSAGRLLRKARAIAVAFTLPFAVRAIRSPAAGAYVG